ncbi:MAG: aminopeptidase N [Gammaproteobacteria bacterium]|nr:MAG: aminopeptidase N [Gammaproteobacteria bacterium]
MTNTNMPDAPQSDTPQPVFLKDYKPPEFLVESIELVFALEPGNTRVHSIARYRRNPECDDEMQSLHLDGNQLQLTEILLNGHALGDEDYQLKSDQLIIHRVPDRFELKLTTLIKPKANTALSGLYTSEGNFVTQCEAEGFRRITYFPDRSDVLTVYTVTIQADQIRFPVLLSNGNLVEEGVLPDGRHFAKWHDPHPKPSYLFALVAGDLKFIEDCFTTCSGKDVRLRIYVQAHNIDKCDHAMASLKKSMRWDEETYGREYDLDVFNIVAVDDFNMGAMENKGLNIFNSKYILARPETATDADYTAIEAVIGHEYFHNWSGNRVTCRDWFQLSLKEGFTVFREQQFSEAMGSAGVKRIQDVNLLRNHQFREDAGPMAHPVRPDSYIEINNFYTSTVYNKGAEVVRMLFNLLSADGFRKGCDLYFERHDGHAVTTDDFVKAMEDANQVDLTQFRRWYSQAGTPVIRVTSRYDPKTWVYELVFEQSCPSTPGQKDKAPFHIPLAIGLLDNRGNDTPLKLAGEDGQGDHTKVLHLKQPKERFAFEGVSELPVPSLLRAFSAPVKLVYEHSLDELAFLIGHDHDAFNQWDAAQQLGIRIILEQAGRLQSGQDVHVDERLIDVYRKLLYAQDGDQAMLAQLLTLPAENYLNEFMQPIDPLALNRARWHVMVGIASALRHDFLKLYHQLDDTCAYSFDAPSVGRRALRNLCLSYLMLLDEAHGEPKLRQHCVDQYQQANNMTDALAALGCLTHIECPEREAVMNHFHDQWQDDAQVMDKWLSLQALSRAADTPERVIALLDHPVFSIKNPNKVRALVGAYCANVRFFHAENGSGYDFLRDQLRTLNTLNPQMASRLVSVFAQWRRYAEPWQSGMRDQLEQLNQQSDLSRDVYEIVSKSLDENVL